jgi:MoaA/NifB/PqqE/SkfB family radical SAM enzyme
MPDYKHLDNTTWCSMAWMHQFIDPQGRVKPCCRFNMPKDIEKENNLNNQALGNIFYGKFMNDVRNKMINNQEVPGCIRCYQEEASGKKSLRERYNSMYELHPNNLIHDLNDPTIRWMELAISNDCNLACRMCDSRYAWKWFDDEKELYGVSKSKDKFTKSDISSIDRFLDKIVHIKFTGGEPLIIPDHFKLLDKLSIQDNVSSIYLNYSTNLTINPKQDTIDKWKKFKYIEFACSFDGIGPTWELVRYPSKWETAEKVTQNFLKMTNDFDCRVGLRSSISLNNILNMPEAFDWWIKNWNEYASTPFSESNWINPTHVTFPNYLSTTVLPLKYKDIIAKKLNSRKNDFGPTIKNSLESQINYMYSKDDTYLMPELKQYTLHFDSKRKQDFFIANPELIGLFDGV